MLVILGHVFCYYRNMNSKQQYILARDTIDMIRDYANDANVLEYLDSFCFSLARLFEESKLVDWDTLASICDQRYYLLKNEASVAIPAFNTAILDKMHRKYTNLIKMSE